MKIFNSFLMASTILVSGCSRQSDPGITTAIDRVLTNSGMEWTLQSPKPTQGCAISLLFTGNSKVILGYKGKEYEGYYEIDSVLTNYITINVFNKPGWDESCPVNPAYLSLYDDDTQFSYRVIDDRLYFEKNEKVIIFQRQNSMAERED